MTAKQLRTLDSQGYNRQEIEDIQRCWEDALHTFKRSLLLRRFDEKMAKQIMRSFAPGEDHTD